MVNRVFIDGSIPRIICSKPGYNADLSLANEHKTFDSDWYYGGGIRWILNTGIGGGQYPNINFPISLNYSPRVHSFYTKQWYGDPYLFEGIITGVPSSEWNPPHGGWVINNNAIPICRISNYSLTGTEPVYNDNLYSGGLCVAVIYGD